MRLCRAFAPAPVKTGPVATLALGLACLGALACTGRIGDPAAGEGDPAGERPAPGSGTDRTGGVDEGVLEPPPGDLSPCRTPTFEVYRALKPTCEGCHRAGTSVPSFASLEAFENLIAYAPRHVTPGEPGSSRLVALLRGEASGSLRQMPVGERSFVELEREGRTQIGLAEIESWIAELEICEVPPSDAHPTVSRVPAEVVRASLEMQLGLTAEQIERTGFPLATPHEIPRPERGATRHWQAVGGPDYLRGTSRRQDVGPLFVQTLVPMAQAWCRAAVEAAGNDALFRYVGRTTDSATDAPAIRRNVAYLYLRMLGVVTTEAEVSAMYEDVYRPYEARGGPETAWVAVCATLVRDPLWLTY